jgi:ribosomal protein S10
MELPVFMKMAPAPLASRSEFNVTFSLLLVEEMETPALMKIELPSGVEVEIKL